MKFKTGIEIIMGKPGSGKSTYGAWLAKKYLDKGYPVWSNTPIAGTYQFNLRNDAMIYDMSNGLVIIDEAGIEMDSRDFKNFPKNLVEFFKLHRHYNLRVVVLTQYWDDVDKKVRVLCNRIAIIQKTIFSPLFILMKDVVPRITIDEETEQIVEKYNFRPVLAGGHHYVYKRLAWKLFNTHERKELVQRDWQVWSSLPSRVKLTDYYRKLIAGKRVRL